ncbi:Putative cryptic C4-dicarboxylate transporter DcuD [Sporomusa rhizae]|uniref:C4-dicarboxylate transporter DcuC n=1 Tax=Sporomusa rhizae TaxID=357999 RepID=UPI00352A1575
MIWLGGLIVLLTFAAIIKRYETRMVLFTSGLIMALISGKPLVAIDAFATAMVNPGLVTVICTVMGFAYVMKLTKCDAHLVHLLAGGLTKCRPILIPGTIVITFAINIALPSAAGCAAAVGAIMIPALIGAGVHPALAGSAVLAGTWGSTLSPGATHNPFIAKLANTDVMTVIAVLTPADLAALAVVVVVLTATAYLRKEHNVTMLSDVENKQETESFKVNLIKAIVPVVPLVLLVLGSKQVHVIPEVTVPQAMIFGTILGFVVTLVNAQEITKQFFAGMGDAFGSVVGIIIAAAVFNKGMELIGLTGALIDAMKHSESIAKLAATFGPFIVAVLSGSGDAATLAFNGAITPHAQQFGFGIIQMGQQAQVVGALGRSMSPVAGAAIVCAGLAGVNPVELTKRNGPAMLLAAIVTMVVLM